MSQTNENQQSAWARKMPISEQIAVIRRMFKYASPFKWRFFIAIIFSIVMTAIGVLMPRVVQFYMDNYLEPMTATVRTSVIFAIVYLLLILSQGISYYFSTYIFGMASEKTVELLRNSLFTKLNNLGMRFFDQTPSGSIVSRVTNDTETIKDFWNVFYALFEGIVTLISVFIGMYLLNRRMALLFLIFVPLMAVMIWFYQSYSSRVYRTMRESLSRLNTRLNESILGMSIIQDFRQEKRLIKEFENENEEQYRGRVAMVRMNALLLMPVINLLEGISLALVFWVLGNQFFDGFLEIGVIYAFTQYSTSFFRPMGMMMDSLSLLQDGVVSSSRILRIIDHKESVPEQIVDPNAKISDAKVEFKDVSFSYDNENYVLKNISFTVNPGETVALVGHTGSGKSSIINVLMRFYEFQEGEILFDGHDIRSFSYEDLRSEIGLVLQDSFLFHGDVSRNIRLLDQSISDATVRNAARFVHADTFIEADPANYSKRVIERGASYSTGQKQLISFARTMARNPKLLILDEATANIDTETEEYIQSGLNRMRENRTTIAIAHRLSTIKDANQIIVLDKGRILEQGTHDELIEKQGTYYQMYRLQTME
ncbi:ABC transporter ATP-binding protein [Fundicoccus sp. Sow4_H7]|uniref:ABC transporter ATP-binding protein n=1 Tax=Fundicoccus sp. Sow4_H7 TaxID=3438784 RepID=UPI003F9123E0